jgi:DNA repair exonuclease SbcCD ATPase subunit
MNYSYYANKISRMSGKQELLQKRKDTDSKTITQLKQDLIYLEAAQAFIQQVAKDTQEQLRFMISDIVNLALDTCFPGEYEFNVNFEIKRGKTEASLSFIKNGIEVDPMEASGGGVVDLASFALRIAAWSLGRSNNTIILDEPFRFLSKDLHPRAGEILKKLSEHLKLQIILITHNEEIITYAHKVFEVSQNSKTGISKVMERA